MVSEETISVNEAYRNLMTAIVQQACNDYAGVLANSKTDKIINPHNTPSYKFLMDNPYCEILDIDGPSLVKKMERNFKKYGKAIPKDQEWEMINKLGKIVSYSKWNKMKGKENKNG